MKYTEYKALIEHCGVHEQLGPAGEGFGIEQNPHELATFLAAVDGQVRTVLEIGTGYRAGLARFMSQMLGWKVTSVDVQDYGHSLPGVEFIVLEWPGVEYPVFNEGFDLVIIDGNHAYDSVQADDKHYGKLGRVVMFHDIAGLRNCEGAAQYWREISRTKRGSLHAGHDEVIDEGAQAAGIGWVVR